MALDDTHAKTTSALLAASRDPHWEITYEEVVDLESSHHEANGKHRGRRSNGRSGVGSSGGGSLLPTLEHFASLGYDVEVGQQTNAFGRSYFSYISVPRALTFLFKLTHRGGTASASSAPRRGTGARSRRGP